MASPSERYIPTQWETSSSKARFETQFKKFVSGGFKFRDFPKWFYQRLSNTFGHIAHYNQHGFYQTFFEDPAGKQRFIDMTLNWPCHGDPGWTYSDVEKVLQDWMRKLVDGQRNLTKAASP